SEPVLALHLFEKALDLAAPTQDAHPLAAAHAGIGFSSLALGQFEKAQKHLESAVEMFGERLPDTVGQILTLGQSAPFLLACSLVVLGYPVKALEISNSALDTGLKRSEPYSIAVTLNAYVLTYDLAFRDISSIADHVRKLVAITADHEMTIFQA